MGFNSFGVSKHPRMLSTSLQCSKIDDMGYGDFVIDEERRLHCNDFGLDYTFMFGFTGELVFFDTKTNRDYFVEVEKGYCTVTGWSIDK